VGGKHKKTTIDGQKFHPTKGKKEGRSKTREKVIPQAAPWQGVGERGKKPKGRVEVGISGDERKWGCREVKPTAA